METSGMKRKDGGTDHDINQSEHKKSCTSSLQLLENTSRPVTDSGLSNRLKESILNILYPHGRKPRNSYTSLPGPLPATLSRSQLSLLANEEYWVAEKSDGIRKMLLVSSGNCFIVDRAYDFQQLDAPEIVKQLGIEGDTLIDGELVDTTWDRNCCFLAYDAIMVNGKPLAMLKLGERLHKLKTMVVDPLCHLQSDTNYPGIVIQMKRILRKGNVSDIVRMIRPPHVKKDGTFEKNYMFEDQERRRFNQNDGLVFTRDDDSYLPSKKYSLLKWKWPELNTIDFKIKRPWYDDRSPEKDLLLYSGSYGNSDICVRRTHISSRTRHWIESEFIRRNIDEAVVECSYEPQSSSWKIHKWRKDKTKANFITTVISTLETIIDSVKVDEICKACSLQK